MQRIRDPLRVNAAELTRLSFDHEFPLVSGFGLAFLRVV